MDAVRLQRVSELFESARQQPEDRRDAYLRAECKDPHVLDEVVSLLRHHGDDAAPLDEPLLGNTDAASALMAIDERRAAPTLERIGQYRILRLLGEGGMGAVYLAEQERPRRTVALKVIRSGLATRRTLRRFEFEASVLGMLNHPGIAQIYEAGVHDDGSGPRPFFAMEYVEGRPLTTHAREASLGTHDRLELVANICDAVQHAHQRGVIHRDLKPGNILVDAAGLPKVLDFGVARATDSDLQVTTIQTDIGQLVGTLPYMSPEQVTGDVSQLDTRSDVYSLGVVLYELLSGRLPHDLRGKTIAEAARVIGEDEPTPLSSIDRVFRGDLHTIVSRALVRDKERRYASAADLAADIRRFLRDEPIEAKRDSMSYVLRRRLKRYRMAVAAGVIFTIGLLGFALYAAAQAREQSQLAQKERDARRDAEEAGRKAAESEHNAETQRDEARKARDAEAQRSQQALAVTAFLVNTLGIANPDVAQTADLTKEMMLAKASSEVGEAFPGQPEAEATVRAVIGKAYAALGEAELATEHLWRAIRLMRAMPTRDRKTEYELHWPYVQMLSEMRDPAHQRQVRDLRALAIDLIADRLPEVKEPLQTLFDDISSRRNRESVEAVYASVMDAARAKLEPNDAAWTPLADVIHEASPRARRGDMRELGHTMLVDALAIQRRMLGETNTRVVRILDDLLAERLEAGHAHEAAALAEQSLEILAKVLPDDHWYAAMIRFRLGECLAAQGKRAEAVALMTSAAERIVESRGLASEPAIRCLESLVHLHDDGSHEPELARYRAQFAAARAGGIRPTVITQADDLLGPGVEPLIAAMRAVQTGVSRRPENLMTLVDDAVTAWHEHASFENPGSALVADFLTAMAERLMNSQGTPQYDVAHRMVSAAAAFDAANGIRHPRRRALTQWWLARLAELQGDHVGGERFARASVSILESGPTERSGFLAIARGLLGGCIAGQGRFDEAEPLLLEGYFGSRDDLDPHDMNTLTGLQRLIDLYEAWGRPDDAMAWRMTQIEVELTRPEPDAALLNSAAWQVVVRGGLDERAYALALEAARKATTIQPRNASVLNTRGVAEYRCGRLTQARETLFASDKLAGGGRFEDAAFLALVHHALNENDAAAVARSRFDAAAGTLAERSRTEYEMLRAELARTLTIPAPAAER